MARRLFLVIGFLGLWCFAAFADTVHVMQKGETVYGLSRQYGIPMQQILDYNGIKDATKIIAGQKIKIPTGNSSAKTATQTYIVQKGDTVYGIAKKFGITQNQILSLNNLTSSSVIQVGQKLLIPSAGGTQSASSSGTAQSSGLGSSGASSQVVAQGGSQSAGQTAPSVEVPTKTTDDLRQYTEKKANTNLIWPIKSDKISYLDDKTSGVVIEGAGNDAVTAIASGKVVSSGSYRGYSNVVFVKSTNDYIYVYAGLKSVSVKVGQSISVGEKLGQLPEKALFTQSKLYFMVYKKNTSIDPALAPRGV